MKKEQITIKPLLPGTASGLKWKIVNAQMGKSSIAATDPTEAIFPIFSRVGTGWSLVGTGFYITSNGAFVTARHVAEVFSTQSLAATILHINPDGSYLFRPVDRWSLHEEADVAVGWPAAIKDNKLDAEYLGVSLICQHNRNLTEPDLNIWLQEPVMTYGYPLHEIVSDGANTKIHLQPNMYDGKVESAHWHRGPSVKLSPPYLQTTIALYGASSGGPVFCSRDGSVIGVASASYDGVNDVSFITPIAKAMEIAIPEDMLSPPQEVPVSIGQFLEKTQSQ